MTRQEKEEMERLKNELEFIRQYIHEQGLEWDLLSKFQRAENEFAKTIK